MGTQMGNALDPAIQFLQFMVVHHTISFLVSDSEYKGEICQNCLKNMKETPKNSDKSMNKT